MGQHTGGGAGAGGSGNHLFFCTLSLLLFHSESHDAVPKLSAAGCGQPDQSRAARVLLNLRHCKCIPDFIHSFVRSFIQTSLTEFHVETAQNNCSSFKRNVQDCKPYNVEDCRPGFWGSLSTFFLPSNF